MYVAKVNESADDLSEYDCDALEAALKTTRPTKYDPRVPWDEYADKDPNEGDDRPGLPGCELQAAAIEAGRCGCPLKNSRERFGQLRFCTSLPDRRFGRGRWDSGSVLCGRHKHLQAQGRPPVEIFEHYRGVRLPYNTR